MSQKNAKQTKHVKHAEKADRKAAAPVTKAKAVIKTLRVPLSKLISRRADLLVEIKKASYFGRASDLKVDSKQQTPTTLGERELALIDEEIKTMRSAVRAAIGTKGFNAKLWYQPSRYTTSTGGNFSISISLNPVSCPEWATWVALFDLYRVSHVIAHFKILSVKDAQFNATLPSDMLTSIAAASYTPIAVTLYTAVTQLLDDEKHHIVPLSLKTGFGTTNVAPAGVMYANWALESETHSFRMKMPSPGVVSVTDTVTPGDWHPTSDTTDIEGYFNLFSSGFALCDIFANVIYEYEVEFRCRD